MKEKKKTTKKTKAKVPITPHKKPKTKSKEVKLESVPENSNKTGEYIEFVTFIAIPSVLRKDLLDVKTQDDFAKKYGVNKDTLSDWKKRAGFLSDVMRIRQEFFKQRSGDVILSLETTCIKDGKGSDVKVYLTYTGEYKERQETEHIVDPALAKAIDNINKFVIPN